MPLIISCKENSRADQQNQILDSSSILIKPIKSDSITKVTIFYYPSFTNSSTLQLDRLLDVGVLKVDTMITFSYGRPDTLLFSIKEMENATRLKSFWDKSFIYSLKQDTSMGGWTDGMPVYIYFTNNEAKDSVYLGNVFPHWVNNALMEQFDYFQKKSTNKAMKAYIKQLKGYVSSN